MYTIILITIVSLLLVIFGLSGCSQPTVSVVQDTHMAEHECDNVEVVLGSAYDSKINVNWAY